MNPPRHFFVKAIWDDQVRVFHSESDIKGVHTEPETLEEFEAVLDATASQLIFDNHFSAQQISKLRLSDLMPTAL